MHSKPQPAFLLASDQPALLSEMEPVLVALGARVEIAFSAEAALASLSRLGAPALVLLDVRLPRVKTEQMLAAIRAAAGGRRFPVVLIAETIADEWMDRLEEGAVDDLIPASAQAAYWRLRLEMVLRSHQRMVEVEHLRETSAVHEQTDPLTGTYNRATLLSMLFRETDRVQRMNTTLCMILFDIDDFGHWNARLGMSACDDLLVHVAGRVKRLLRSYDLLGRVGKDEFLVALPGCNSENAVLMAERMRAEVFSAPFRLGGQAIRLSACFGVAASRGRSPVVVLREAEQVLREAQSAGPESIQCFSDPPEQQAAPVAFLSPTSGDDLLAW